MLARVFTIRERSPSWAMDMNFGNVPLRIGLSLPRILTVMKAKNHALSHYIAAWTDSCCLLGCDHQHATVTSAAACASYPGSYVIAVDKQGNCRELNSGEELEFRNATYGPQPRAGNPLSFFNAFLPAQKQSA